MTRRKTLNFGKYDGWDIGDVPEDYLVWLMTNSEQTAQMCKDELDRRENEAEANMTWMERIIKTGYRELAKRHHPDSEGGSTQDMQELNASYEALSRALENR